MTDPILPRLTALEARVFNIEQLLHPAPTPVPTVNQEPPLATLYTPDPAPPVDVAPAPHPQVPAPKRKSLPNHLATAATKPTSAPSLETLIGQNWTSWIGGLVLVLGVVFFLKYAWDQGWLAFSPATRVAAAMLTGVALAITGLRLAAKQMHILAATLVGAGTAIVMAATFAAHTAFTPPVLSLHASFVTVALTAVAGIALALHIRSVTVAIIALLGAYLAPAILNTGHDQSLLLITYLAALAGIGWTLSHLRPQWQSLRWFLLAATYTWIALWLLRFGHRADHHPLALAALAFFFLGFTAEAFLTLRRLTKTQSPITASLDATLATFSIIVTTLTFLSLIPLYTYDPTASHALFQTHPLSTVAVALALLHAILSFFATGQFFARGSRIQAAALVAIAIPISTGQYATTLSWLILSLAMAALAPNNPNRTLRVASLTLLGLTLFRLFAFDAFNPALTRTLFTLTDQPITPWLLLAITIASAAHLIARLCSTTAPNSDTAATLTAANLTFLAAIFLSWTGPLTTLAAAFLAAANLALATRHRKPVYLSQAAVLLTLAAIKCLTLDTLLPAIHNWSAITPAPTPFLNLPALTIVLLIAQTIWLTRKSPKTFDSIAPTAIATLAFALLNFETLNLMNNLSAHFTNLATAKQVALSILWATTGLAAVITGFAKNRKDLRLAALTLLGITLFKTLILDMANVQPVYRILSFTALGALLLCVSFVYHKHATTRLTPSPGTPGEGQR